MEPLKVGDHVTRVRDVVLDTAWLGFGGSFNSTYKIDRFHTPHLIGLAGMKGTWAVNQFEKCVYDVATASLGTNPKDLIGIKKPSPFYFPPIALLHGSRAMMSGAKKYGAYNWRGNAVVASIYLAAAIRHVSAFQDGEQNAPDSKVHHLGHAIASLAILLDAEATGNLIDDRPKGGKFAEVLEQFTEK